MSVNIVKVSGDYKIKSGNGNTITLDTGSVLGDIILNGNVSINGNIGIFNFDELRVKDNIIVINYGETGSGVSENIAGISIDRGTAPEGNAEILWDETISWNDPVSQTQKFGLFTFKTDSGGINGIQTNAINTNGGDLNLINFGTGIISVSGTNNYEQQVLNYSASLIPYDDDIIPNIRAVFDLVDFQINNTVNNKLSRDDTELLLYDNNITSFIFTYATVGLSNTIRVNHPLVTNSSLLITIGTTININGSGILNLDGTWTVFQANPEERFFTIIITNPINLSTPVLNIATVTIPNAISSLKLKVNNIPVAEFRDSRFDVFNIRLQNNSISTNVLNGDLSLTTNGTGDIIIDDTLKIPYRLLDPDSQSNSVKIYSKTPSIGQTGIYFRNTEYNDELISKKKAIAFSILM
jgi:hypothetical protein